MSNLKIDSVSVDAGNNSQTAKPEKSIEELKNEIVVAIRKILALAQDKTIFPYQRSQDEHNVLLEEIYANQSLFGRVALWYVNLSWWVKLIHIAVIGLICCASLALGLVVLSGYSALVLLFNDYHNLFAKQNKAICSIVENVDVYLHAAAKKLSDIEDNLNQVLTGLCSMNLLQIDCIESFEEKIDEIGKNTQLFIKVTDEVPVAQDSLTSATSKFSHVLQQLAECCNDSHEFIAGALDISQQTDEHLSTKIDLLQSDHERLTTVNRALAKNVDTLAKSIDLLAPSLEKRKYHNSLRHGYPGANNINLQHEANITSPVDVVTCSIVPHAISLIEQYYQMKNNPSSDVIPRENGLSHWYPVVNNINLHHETNIIPPSGAVTNNVVASAIALIEQYNQMKNNVTANITSLDNELSPAYLQNDNETNITPAGCGTDSPAPSR